jgi:hypothetical protein
MLPVKQDVIDLIDPSVESFNLIKQMRDDITCQTTEHTKRGNVESEEV